MTMRIVRVGFICLFGWFVVVVGGGGSGSDGGGEF